MQKIGAQHETSKTLALYHARLGAWREVVSLLASDAPGVRHGALAALETLPPPPALMPIVAALLGEAQEAVRAILSAALPEAFAKALAVLVDRLGHEDPIVRGVAVSLIEERHERGELPRIVSASARELLARMNVLMSHRCQGLSAPGGGTFANRTTSLAATWILQALAAMQVLDPEGMEQLASQVGDDDDEVARKAEQRIELAVLRLPIDEPGHVLNHLLDPARIPVGTRDLGLVNELAMSFHAYSVLGSSGAVMQFGNAARRRFRKHGKVPITATGARIALFLECRRRVHTASDMTEEGWRYTDALLLALRQASLRGSS